MAVGGLEDFDADAAAQQLASVGTQPVPLAIPGQEAAAPVVAAPDPYQQADAQDAQQGLGFQAPAVAPPPVPAPAEQQPAAAAVPGQPVQKPTPDDAIPPPPAWEPLPPPARPALTGDPAKDAAANIEYQRQLGDYHTHLSNRHADLTKYAAAVQAAQSGKEAAVETERQKRADAEIQRAEAERKANQSAIDTAVREKSAAAKDLEGFKWDKPYTGAQIASIIAGAFAQGLQNRAAILTGHAPTAQNDALKLIDARMHQDYEQRKEKLANAGDALLQARYGFKDSAENHRAAMNDLDAEFSAKYRAIAKEAEARLRRSGASQAEIAGNIVVADSLAKAAAAEGQILDRQEGHQIQRDQNQATLKLAEANLGVRRLAEKDSHLDRVAAREDRRAAAADREAAKKEKAAEKEDTTAVRDEGGAVIGHVPTGKGGAQGFATRDADYGRGEEQLQALLDDVKKNGGRVLSPEAIKRRETLYHNAVIGVATVSPLGKTNEAMEQEAGSLGKSGGLSLVGANPEAIQRKIDELRTQRERYRTQTLIPVGGAEKKGGAGKPAAKREPSTREFLQNLLDEGE
jgi:hypothetical protein